ERALRSCAAPRETPFVLVEKAGGTMRVAAVDASAAALGIAPGLTLTNARARIPDLVAVAHDPAADMALLDWLADACDRFSPMVATDPPRGIVIDITGCVHPFGDEAGLAADLSRRVQRHGLSPAIALADTPEAANALAAFGGDTVTALPVAALRVDGEIHQALRRAGLKTIGSLARRPRGPLAARFGVATTTALERLLGQADARITPRRHPPEIEVETRFAEPVATTDTVLATLDALMRRAATALSDRSRGGRRFEAALFRSDGHVARLGIDTGQPTRDAGILARLFRERIDTLADPLDPGFGYDLIRLAVPVTEPLAAHQLQLDGGAVADAELAALIDRLTIRLGRGRVRWFRAGDGHVPEQAAFDLPSIDAVVPVAWHTPEPGEPPLRPLHLFDPPQRIEAIAEVPDGPPFRFRWRRVLHEVRRAEGPERIAAEWWRHRRGAGLTRDYYRVEDQAGRRFWVFRHGLYGVERAVPEWYLHGLFA
ncbi:MAG: Y-family DNA polymerase, partial [Janthinobacterium lividum]